jgi:hypothetical protein
MSTAQTPIRIIGIFKCPPDMPRDTFVEKCELATDAIVALPCSRHLLKYELVRRAAPFRRLLHINAFWHLMCDSSSQTAT